MHTNCLRFLGRSWKMQSQQKTLLVKWKVSLVVMSAGLLSLKLVVAFLIGFLSATFLHVWFIWPHPQRFGTSARTERQCHNASHGVILVPRIPTTSSLVMWLNWQKWNWGVILLPQLGVQHGLTGWSQEGKPAQQSHAKSMHIAWSTNRLQHICMSLPSGAL